MLLELDAIGELATSVCQESASLGTEHVTPLLSITGGYLSDKRGINNKKSSAGFNPSRP